MAKIGIDIGGTTIKGALFSGGKIVAESSAPTMGTVGREAILQSMHTVIGRLMSEEVTFIGVASAGNIDARRGVCVYATDNLKGWTGLHIAEEVQERYGVRCRAENDAICALLGETGGDLSHDVTMLTFGTGVGGASIVNGSVVRGKNFDAARWGHVVLYPGGRVCNCGKQGCAEQYLSATALLRSARRAGLHVSDCEAVMRAFVDGDSRAERVVRSFVQDLLTLLSNICTAIAPEKIILGGGLMNAWDAFSRVHEMPPYAVRAALGGKAGIYGAGVLDDTDG